MNGFLQQSCVRNKEELPVFIYGKVKLLELLVSMRLLKGTHVECHHNQFWLQGV